MSPLDRFVLRPVPGPSDSWIFWPLPLERLRFWSLKSKPLTFGTAETLRLVGGSTPGANRSELCVVSESWSGLTQGALITYGLLSPVSFQFF